MATLYLIDGYNLLHAMGVLQGRVGPLGLEKARLRLLGGSKLRLVRGALPLGDGVLKAAQVISLVEVFGDISRLHPAIFESGLHVDLHERHRQVEVRQQARVEAVARAREPVGVDIGNQLNDRIADQLELGRLSIELSKARQVIFVDYQCLEIIRTFPARYRARAIRTTIPSFWGI